MLFDLVTFALSMGTVVINLANKIINFSFPENYPPAVLKNSAMKQEQ